MTKEHIILDQKSIGVSQYFFGLSERKNGIRYEDELEECGIPSKTWKQAGQMELQIQRKIKQKRRNVPDCGLNKCTTELGMQIRIKEV